MPAASRLGDQSHAPADSHGCKSCSHPVTGPAVTGSSDVIINGKPALRLGDTGVHKTCCGANQWKTVAGSATVFINGKPAVRLGDATQHCGGAGTVIEGSSDVLIGDDSGVAAGASTAHVDQIFDEHFIVLDERSGTALENVEFVATGPAGTASTGATDAAGKTSLMKSTGSTAVTLDVRQTTLVIG